MKSRPILFSAPMVRAILEGRKTQTRRDAERAIVKASGCLHSLEFINENGKWFYYDNAGLHSFAKNPVSPYGKPGDQLWVKETFGTIFCPEPIRYRATEPTAPVDKWTPSIFMPRWASRITLEITAVRVERLQDITEEDAIAEGCCRMDNGLYAGEPHRIKGTPTCCTSPKIGYQRLWESINGEESWYENPLVWVIEFRRIRPDTLPKAQIEKAYKVMKEAAV